MQIEMVESELSVPDPPTGESVNSMSKRTDSETEMRDHYDFSGGVRGKYLERLKNAGQIVLLEPDVAEVFTTSESVNETLRGLLPIIQTQVEKSHQS